MKPHTLITIVALAAVPAVGFAQKNVMGWPAATLASRASAVAGNNTIIATSGAIGAGRSRQASAFAAATTDATKLYEAANAKMHHAMAIAYTGDSDLDFARSMIPHHQGAIDMATVVLEYGQDPEIRQLAQQIIEAQKGEIAWLKEWLAKKGP